MDDLKAIHLIQQYRHDVLNQLQLLSGYLSMKRPEKAEEKLIEWIHYFEEERRLTSLHMPKFALWVIQFNAKHQNIRLSYTIGPSGTNYEQFDELLWTIGETFIQRIQLILDNSMLCDVCLNLKEDEQNIYLGISIESNEDKDLFEAFNEFDLENENVQVIRNSSSQNFVAYEFVIAK